MGIKNYTSESTPTQSIALIEKILISHGAKRIMKEYNDAQEVSGINFIIQTDRGMLPIKMPARTERVKAILEREGNTPRAKIEDQAKRTAWKNIHDWIASQMALLETDMVKIEEIFLPYIVQRGGKTLYENMENKNFLLE